MLPSWLTISYQRSGPHFGNPFLFSIQPLTLTPSPISPSQMGLRVGQFQQSLSEFTEAIPPARARMSPLVIHHSPFLQGFSQKLFGKELRETHGFQCQLHYLATLGLWTGFMTFLGLSLLISKVGLRIDGYEDQTRNILYNELLAHCKHSINSRYY